jgi:hypothetical protein
MDKHRYYGQVAGEIEQEVLTVNKAMLRLRQSGEFAYLAEEKLVALLYQEGILTFTGI